MIGRTLDVSFILTIGLALFCWRAPAIFLNTEINVDESQTLAQAICFHHDATPWRSADATTSGPLNTYIYMWPYIINTQPTFITLRITSLILIWITVTALFNVSKKLLDDQNAYIALLPCLLYLLYTTGPDFMHASTEWLPVALTACSFALSFKVWQGNARPIRCIIIGLLLGSVPLAKLQGVPTAGILGLALCARIIYLRQQQWKSHTACLIAGALFVPIIILLAVIKGGAFDEMWIRYFIQNFNYQGDFAQSSYLERLRLLLMNNGQIVTYLAWGIGTIITSLFLKFREVIKSKDQTTLAIALLVWMTGTIFSIVKTGHNFPHYLTFLVFPTSICAFFAMRAMGRDENRSVISCTFIGMIGLLIQGWVTPNNLGAYTNATLSSSDFRDPVSRYVSEESSPGDTLGIWGWTPRYFAETQLRSATRDMVSYFLITEHPFQQHYRDTYLADLKRSSPRIFIDTATDFTESPKFLPLEQRRHTNFPALRDYISENYDKVGEMTPQNFKTPFWIYVRKLGKN